MSGKPCPHHQDLAVCGADSCRARRAEARCIELSQGVAGMGVGLLVERVEALRRVVAALEADIRDARQTLGQASAQVSNGAGLPVVWTSRPPGEPGHWWWTNGKDVALAVVRKAPNGYLVCGTAHTYCGDSPGPDLQARASCRWSVNPAVLPNPDLDAVAPDDR